MNITEAQLDAQYQMAKAALGDLIDQVEQDYNLPPFSMYALGSRETNLDPYYQSHAGDGGHGRGLWQVDDRSHDIPDDWATNVEWQCRAGADIFNDCLGAADDDFVAACNYYNSGQPNTSGTTGRDYGPDVNDRRNYLVSKYGQGDNKFVAGQSLVNLNSGYAIDVGGQSMDDRAQIIQWNVNGQKNQSVVLEDAGNGLTRIKFEHSGKYLDSDPNRLEAVQFSNVDVPGQKFLVERASNGAFHVVAHDGRLLDIEHVSTDAGAKVIFWEDNGGPNQQFVIVNFR